LPFPAAWQRKLIVPIRPNNPLTIKHVKEDGTVYYYEASVTKEGEAFYAEFIVTKRFFAVYAAANACIGNAC
jgi:hypothetical protein